MKETLTLATALPLSKVTVDQLERALDRDQENNDLVAAAVAKGDHKTLPETWEAMRDLPLKSLKLAQRLAAGVMSSAQYAAQDHSIAPFSIMAMRFMAMGYELGLIVAEEAQKKDVN